jgi:hypothetical protein
MADPQATPGFPLWSTVGVISIWALVSFYLAAKSDWRLLARKYRASDAPEGRSLRGQLYQVGSVHENHVTRLVVSPRGLYLGPLLIVRLGRPPLLIPWAAITGVRRGRTLGRSWYSLNVAGLTLIRVGEDAFEAMRAYVPPPVDAAA